MGLNSGLKKRGNYFRCVPEYFRHKNIFPKFLLHKSLQHKDDTVTVTKRSLVIKNSCFVPGAWTAHVQSVPLNMIHEGLGMEAGTL